MLATQRVNEGQRRPLVVLVGPECKRRADLARELLDRDTAVVLCSGPPGCALVRDDSCPLNEAADMIVVLPTESADRETLTSLSLCAERARNALVVEPSTVRSDVSSARVRTTDAAKAASLVTTVLHHPPVRRARGI